jgi:hypothetical protein
MFIYIFHKKKYSLIFFCEFITKRKRRKRQMKQKLTESQIDHNLEELKIFLRENCIPCTNSIFEDVITSMIREFKMVSTRKKPCS